MAELATNGHAVVDINNTAAAAEGAKRTEQQPASPDKPCHLHVQSSPAEDECAVCMEPLEFVAIGPCGHISVCSKCALRIRIPSLGNNRRECCICREPCPVVVVTRAGVTGKKPAAAVHAKLPALGGYHGPVGEYWYHGASAAYFDDERQYQAACSEAAARAAAAALGDGNDDGGGVVVVQAASSLLSPFVGIALCGLVIVAVLFLIPICMKKAGIGYYSSRP